MSFVVALLIFFIFASFAPLLSPFLLHCFLYGTSLGIIVSCIAYRLVTRMKDGFAVAFVGFLLKFHNFSLTPFSTYLSSLGFPDILVEMAVGETYSTWIFFLIAEDDFPLRRFHY